MKRLEQQPTELYTKKQRFILDCMSEVITDLKSDRKDIVSTPFVLHLGQNAQSANSFVVDFETGKICFTNSIKDSTSPSGIAIQAERIANRVMDMEFDSDHRPNRKSHQLLFMQAAIRDFKKAVKMEMHGIIKREPHPTSA